MNEIPKIPWGVVLSSFAWILGASIILVTLSYYEFLAHILKTKKSKLFQKTSLKKPLYLALGLIAAGICTSFILHISPAKEEAMISKDIGKLPLASFEGPKTIEGNLIFMPISGVIKSKKIYFEKSKYEIRIISKGSRALGETARLKVFVGLNLVADYFTAVEFNEKIIEFKSKKEHVKRLKIWFDNDYYDPEKNLDRNVWIRSVEILKIDNI